VAQNFGFGPSERLPGNVAHLTINGFVPLLGPAVEEAIGVRMTDVADADAVIIDLRDTTVDRQTPWPSSRATSSRTNGVLTRALVTPIRSDECGRAV
jgi:hypothetical protein